MKPKAVIMILAACLLAPGLGAQSNSPVQYFYDASGRLTSAVDTSGNVATYHYDAVGNLLSITRSTLPGSNGLAILSFAPMSGGVGTTVVIQGQGFNTTAASDTVQFNGITATVTAATNNTLTAVVPSGATTGPISVTVASSTVTSSGNFTVATLSSISVTPASATVGLFGTLSLSALGTYSNGTAQNITTQATWSSSSSAVATVSNTAGSQGAVSGVGAGSATLTAALGTTSASAALQVIAPTSLSISPPYATVAQGMSRQFMGLGVYSNGSSQNLTNLLTWSSSNPAAATVSNSAPTQGLATVVSSSQYTSICATAPSSWGLAAACADLNLSVSSISISPPNASIPTGLQQWFFASLSYNGSPQSETLTPVFSSSNPVVASIDPISGLATGLSAGTTTIKASVGNVSGSSVLTVTTPVPASLTVAPLVSLVADGATQQLKATATLNNGEIEDQTAAATWTSSNPAVATVSNTTGSQGLVTGTGVGSAAITATAGSASNSATVLVESATQTVYPRFAYLGGSDDSITIYTVDAATGQLRPNGYVMEASGSHPYNLAVDPSSKFLFVANAGANSISAYTVNATNGALTPVAGSPFPAGNGPAGLAVDPTANFLYMANFSDGTVSAFTFDPNAGVLTAVSGSPFSVGGHPQYAAVDSGGKFLYIIDNENETVSGFTISPASGALTLITGSPYQMGGLPNGLTVDPSGQHLLVTMQPGLTGQNTGVSVFSINATSGALTLVPGSPFATGALNPSSIVVDPTDQYVYVAGNEGSVADFTLNSSNGVLTALPGTQPFLDYGQPSVLSVDPSGRFVYVTGYYSVTAFGLSPGSGVPIKLANFRTNQLSMSNLVITNGTAAVQSAPQLAYVANAGTTNGSPGSNNVWGFSIDPTAGGLSALGSSPVAEGYSPTAVTSDRLGQFLFVANNCSDPACSASAGSVSAYIINPATGSLTAAPGSPFLAGLNPVGVVVDPSERFVYVLNGSDQTISAYALNSATGSLSLVAGSPFPINVPNACYSALSPTATSLAMDPLGTGLLVGIGCGQFQYGYLTGAAISRYTGAVLSPSGPSSTLGDPLALLEEPTENYIYFGSDWYSTEEQTCRLPETPEGPACYPAGGQPSAIAVDATGRFLYVANATSDDISGYAIDPGGSGSLTPIPGSPFVAGTNPVSITVDVSGQYVYVVCRGDNDVWAYSIDQVSGTLTQTIGSPYPVGLLPVSITTTGKTQ